ncbi:hypothetical protein K1T71_000440 [Dendrolimus kikuchii]|uniref:Uncharacterized protein n=1 Tax=Dendrolimus kikuchii TaxID=765133 RepID=A0ACC1DK75_9NEOP|nr:hypothetical protein K1T71_000440 [Dendrolimus kikuchii]
MQTSQQASERRLPTEQKPKIPRQSRSNVKVMLIVFFDCRGVLHSEFLPKNQTVNKVYYLCVMRRLRDLYSGNPAKTSLEWFKVVILHKNWLIPIRFH